MTYDADTLTIDLAILEARATAHLTHAVLLPMETRFGCQHPIHGTHGYFAGCADGGEGNKALLHTHIATTEKNGSKKGIGGMHAEVALHEHMSGREQFLEHYGHANVARQLYDQKLAELTKQANEGAKSLSKADVKTLQTHQKALIKEAAALEKAGRSAAKQRAEATMIQRQLKRSGAVKATTANSRPASAKSKSEKEQQLPSLISRLESLKDSSDPFEAWKTFGGTRESVLAVLRKEPLGALHLLASDHRLPLVGAKTRYTTPAKQAQSIVDRLEEYFRRHP